MHVQLRRRGALERGMALLLVLWMGVALALGASALQTGAREEAVRSRAEVASQRAEALARSALAAAASVLTDPDVTGPTARFDGVVTKISLPSGVASYQIQDQNGLIDVGKATRELLLPAMQSLMRDNLKAQEAVARILRERDRRDGGLTLAEVELLAQSPGLAVRARGLLTSYSAMRTISPFAATARVLDLVPELSVSDREAIMASRLTGAPLPRLSSAEEWFTERDGPIYEISAVGEADDGTVVRIRALVRALGRAFRGGGAVEIFQMRMEP